MGSHIYLTLSGGGLRATFFHLGTLLYLHKSGRINDIKSICAVSGGAILAADLALNWDNGYSQAASFQSTARNFVKKTAYRDIRTNVAARFLLCLMSPILFAKPFWRRFTGHDLNRTALLAAEYRLIFGKKTVSEFQLDVHILATSFTDGSVLDFTKPQVLRWEPSSAMHPNRETNAPASPFEAAKHVPVSSAVACSSAFPPAFPPFRIHGHLVTDGGVYDNLGIDRMRSLLCSEPPQQQRIEVIVSDAGRPFTTSDQVSNIVDRTSRTADIQMERLARMDYKAAESDLESHEIKIRHIKIGEPYSEWDELSRESHERVAGIRTDLDYFSPHLVRALVYHGYASAHERMSKHPTPTEEGGGKTRTDAGEISKDEIKNTINDIVGTNDPWLPTDLYNDVLKRAANRSVVTVGLFRGWGGRGLILWVVCLIAIALYYGWYRYIDSTWSLHANQSTPRMERESDCLGIAEAIARRANKDVQVVETDILPTFWSVRYAYVSSFTEPEVNFGPVVFAFLVRAAAEGETIEELVPFEIGTVGNSETSRGFVVPPPGSGQRIRFHVLTQRGKPFSGTVRLWVSKKT